MSLSSTLKRKAALAAALPVVLAATLGAGSAKAVTVNCTLANFAGCEGATLNEVTFSGFGTNSLSNFMPTASDIVTLDFNALSGYQVFFTTSQAGTFSGNFTYSVALTPTAITDGKTLQSIQANLNGSTINGGSISSTITSPSLTGPATSIGGFGTNVAFNAGSTSANFSQAFSSLTPASLNQVGSAFNTQAEVPGPLPVLGAFAAFGFSRTLRKRIKQAA